MAGRRWTEAEATFVIDNLTRWRIETIGRRLGRTPKAIHRYLQRHGQYVTQQDLITTGVAAALCGRTQMTLYRWASSGRVRARRVPGGRRWLIDPDDLPVA